MDQTHALDCLAALAQDTRLNAYRLLVANEPQGLAAGEIARAVGVPQNTMSTHLATLHAAGLVKSERHSRSIIYRADLECLQRVVVFLLADCCGGRRDLCQPLIAELAPCCAKKPAPKEKVRAR